MFLIYLKQYHIKNMTVQSQILDKVILLFLPKDKSIKNRFETSYSILLPNNESIRCKIKLKPLIPSMKNISKSIFLISNIKNNSILDNNILKRKW